MFSVKQAAEKLGISVALVYSLCAARKIRHERHGLGRGTIRIPPEAIEEYRTARTIGAGSAVAAASNPPAIKPPPPRLRHVRVKL
jgi:excisionase family DNA binding protein